MNVSKKWTFPNKGDLVVSIEDMARDIECVGMVTDTGQEARDKIRTDIRVLWASDSVVDSWHRAYKLEVINEGG